MRGIKKERPKHYKKTQTKPEEIQPCIDTTPEVKRNIGKAFGDEEPAVPEGTISITVSGTPEQVKSAMEKIRINI